MLTDLEVCKRIAEIETGNTGECAIQHHRKVFIDNNFSGQREYNPLTDDALCFKLMVKYDVEREYEPYDFIGWHYKCTNVSGKSYKTVLERTYFGIGEETPDITTNKAICLAIIEAHKPELLSK